MIKIEKSGGIAAVRKASPLIRGEARAAEVYTSRRIEADGLSTGMAVVRAVLFGGIAGAVAWYLVG